MDSSTNRQSAESNYKIELFELLDTIDLRIGERLYDVVPTLSDSENVSYVFYIRITEIFQAIMCLVKTDQIVPAKILLRSLSESFILLKASICDETFNDRHIKSALSEKEKWIKNTILHLDKSGFKQDVAYFEKLKSEMQELQERLDKKLQQTYQLFCDHDEHMLYLNVYSASSVFAHGNRQSFNVYAGDNGSVKPIDQRDYFGLYLSTTFASAHIMSKAYRLICGVFKIDSLLADEIEALSEKYAAKYGREGDE